MNILTIAVAVILAPGLLSAKHIAQPTPAEPLVADVHPSPYRASITYTLNLDRQRFDMRNATIVNMIGFAHGRPDDDGREDPAIIGGPTWIDFDRFDIAALLPAPEPASSNADPPDGRTSRGNPDAKVQLLMERILAERFHLKYHVGDRPLPGYLMTVSKDGAKLAEAKDPAASNNCQVAPDNSNPRQTLITCTSETLAQFFATFGGVFRHPVLNRSGLTKAYDFTLRFSAEQLQMREDSVHAYIDVFSQQLGLVIAPGDVPQPAIFVESVDHAPTPNPPEVARLIPAIPELEFEVATIKPAADSEPQRGIRLTDSQISLVSFTMQELLTRAWEFPTGAMLGNRPDWLVRTRYTILMKLPPGVDSRALSQNSALFDEMLRKLLTERFRMKYHWGEQTVPDAYVLLAGNPRMKKADPSSRSFCKFGPPAGEKDVRTADSPYNGEFHCQNVTMDQFADLAQAVAGSDIKYRVPNRTGLAGSYDFTVYYTNVRKLRADAAAAQAAGRQPGDVSLSSDPVSGLSIEEAFRKQLGLRLEKQSGSYPALVLDHIEEKPTEN
jgi:uncharacterized protein (TIGR03435 family)